MGGWFLVMSMMGAGGVSSPASSAIVGTWSNIYTVTVNQPLIELYGNETITLSATSRIEVINGTP